MYEKSVVKLDGKRNVDRPKLRCLDDDQADLKITKDGEG
jgi:hypothetical protein